MKNAIVTGGTKGIGLAIAKMLLHENYAVTVTYAHDSSAVAVCEDELRKISDSFDIIQADQSDKLSMNSFVEKMRQKSHIDCIILNAGTTFRAGLQTSDEDWERVMQVNVNSSMYLIRDVYDIIPPNSRIVFISSMMGILPHSVSISYGVSKAAEIALAKNLVKEFAGTGTTINVITPGFVDTDWQKSKPQEIRDSICAKTALGRFALPEEIAEAARFCVKNEFVNGSVIEIHGGYNYK